MIAEDYVKQLMWAVRELLIDQHACTLAIAILQ